LAPIGGKRRHFAPGAATRRLVHMCTMRRHFAPGGATAPRRRSGPPCLPTRAGGPDRQGGPDGLSGSPDPDPSHPERLPAVIVAEVYPPPLRVHTPPLSHPARRRDASCRSAGSDATGGATRRLAYMYAKRRHHTGTDSDLVNRASAGFTVCSAPRDTTHAHTSGPHRHPSGRAPRSPHHHTGTDGPTPREGRTA